MDAGRVLDSNAPIALWLTPSDTIQTQTLEALANARHPYRQALAHYFGDRVQVCDLESLQTISPHDVGKAAIVIVATIQSFNVTDTAKRNVYSFFEELAPHFDNLPPNLTAGLETVAEADLQTQPYLTAKDVGRVKHSVANWMHLQRPIVIVDEAHNNKSKLSVEVLERVNAACVLEFTATLSERFGELAGGDVQVLAFQQLDERLGAIGMQPGGTIGYPPVTLICRPTEAARWRRSPHAPHSRARGRRARSRRRCPPCI
mgnify:CR=1 FL=1